MLQNLLSVTTLGFFVKLSELTEVLVATVIFVTLGLIVFAAGFFIIVRVLPFSVKKEIEEDQNSALAILIGSIIIGIAIIISGAISG